MSKYGFTDGPDWLESGRTDSGWTTKDGEILVAIRGLATRKNVASSILKVKLANRSTKVFKIGDVITFNVYFDENVTVTGTPRVPFTIGGASRNANYSSGTGTAVLSFTYTVTQADTGVLALGASIALNGGTIVDVVTGAQNATLTLPVTTLSSTVDAVKPILSSVTVLGGNKYTSGNKIGFKATYNSNVFVTGTPQVDFSVNGTARSASYVSGSGTPNLVFEYTVVSGDSSTAGQVTGATIDLNGGTILDIAGNAALNGSGAVTGTPVVTTAGTGYATPPTVTVGGDGTGATATASVNAGGVTGVTITAPGTGYSFATLSFSGGGGTGAVATVSVDTTAINTSALFTNTGGAVAAPTVTLGTVTGSYKLGENIDIVATFSTKVVVTGAPYVNILINGVVKTASYLSGSGEAAQTFRYTVASGDLASAGQFSIPLNSLVVPSGSSIMNTSDVAAVITHASPTTNAVVIDGVAPEITTFTRVGGPNYVTNDNLDFTVVFNKSVTVTGTPRIKIGIGENTRYANYTSGTGSATLTFRYQIVSGDSAVLPGKFEITDRFISLNGGTIVATAAPNVPTVSPLEFRRPTVSTVTVNA